MDAIKVISLIFVPLFFSSLALSNSITEYNHALLRYEHKIVECSALKNKKFSDSPPSNFKDQDIREALMYFIMKTSEECSGDERQVLLSSIENLTLSGSVSDFILSNAKSLLITFKENDMKLKLQKEKFFDLNIDVQKALKSIEAFSRPFDPLMAVEHYIDSQK